MVRYNPEEVMSDVDQQPANPLCGLCQQFLTDVLQSNFLRNEDYPIDERWQILYSFQRGFRHYETAEELSASAQSCPICRAILEAHAPKERIRISNFVLALFKYAGGGWTYEIRTAKAGSRETFHLFQFKRPFLYDPRAQDQDSPARDEKLQRAVSESPLSQDALDVARLWMKDCADNHTRCSAHAGTHAGTLPTRVIDVGAGPEGSAALYVTNGETGRYAALSHCWGGDIPCKTMTKNVEEYQRGLPMNELPRNFCDAIIVTRGLGLRYLWIDALCILQDSPDDWKSEAAKMATIYSNAAVTLSALESQGSTAGFLKPRRHRQVRIGGDRVLQASGESQREAFDRSVLRTRGWCLQEWLLSPSLLHFGRDQMYWECRTANVQEDNLINNLSVPSVLDAHKSFGPDEALSTHQWYDIVEEFSRRHLTHGVDKLPALAGLADRFRSAGRVGQYVAGLWTQDISQGIFWRGKENGLLTRPAEARAPSWSWASVDGEVTFQQPLRPNLLDVQVTMRVGLDDTTAPVVEGSLKIRGPVAQMRYTHVGGRADFGSLGFEGEEEPMTHCAFMDFDRHVSRDCWVLASGQGEEADILLLEELDAGTFRRIGTLLRYRGNQMKAGILGRFAVRDIVVV